MHARTRLSMDCRTLSRVPGRMRIVLQTSKNASAKCFFILIGTEYTGVSVYPRWQKSEGLRSGERGGCNSKTVCRHRSSSDLVFSYAHKKKYTELQCRHTRIINDREYSWLLCHFACSSAISYACRYSFIWSQSSILWHRPGHPHTHKTMKIIASRGQEIKINVGSEQRWQSSAINFHKCNIIKFTTFDIEGDT
jgi:hypothetical protein